MLMLKCLVASGVEKDWVGTVMLGIPRSMTYKIRREALRLGRTGGICAGRAGLCVNSQQFCSDRRLIRSVEREGEVVG